ncbi:carboxymuconolactone decarboxylase family protein [Actinacidiphila glaucinigra]|uniref:carboxymuconolactone decarboxylase family protein n=1 Tax=Actinacidiphila glaucinigra TaxID=235986 RepID=UPI0036E8F8DF
MSTITTAAGAPSGLGPDDLVPAHAPRMLLGKARPRLLQGDDRPGRRGGRRPRPHGQGAGQARASQLNGCAYCGDQHLHDARRPGLTEQKLHALTVWRETPFLTVRERAAPP